MLCYKLFFDQAINKLVNVLPTGIDRPSDGSFLLEARMLMQFY